MQNELVNAVHWIGKSNYSDFRTSLFKAAVKVYEAAGVNDLSLQMFKSIRQYENAQEFCQKYIQNLLKQDFKENVDDQLLILGRLIHLLTPSMLKTLQKDQSTKFAKLQAKVAKTKLKDLKKQMKILKKQHGLTGSIVSEQKIIAHKQTQVSENTSTTIEEQKTSNSQSEILDTLSLSTSQQMLDASEDLAIAGFLVDMVALISTLKDKKNAQENEVDHCCFSQIEPNYGRRTSRGGSFGGGKKVKVDNDPLVESQFQFDYKMPCLGFVTQIFNQHFDIDYHQNNSQFWHLLR